MKLTKNIHLGKKKFKRSLSITLAVTTFLTACPVGTMSSMAEIPGVGYLEGASGNNLSADSDSPEEIVAGLIRDNTTPGEYVLYPKPHEINYTNQALDLSDGVSIYYEDGVDEYTKARLELDLEENKIGHSETDNINQSGATLLLGIYGSGQAVDQLASGIADASLFQKTDAYLIETKDNKITILGKDADSVYYGVSTFRQMLEQRGNGNILYGVKIRDYSDIAFRGFIEGYYGDPWSLEDRVELMKFGGDYKMNQYIYAPKDDPYHNSKWRELYPDSELPKIEQLAQAGNESKCSFVFAIHPFMNKPFNFNNYETDLATLEARYTQAIEHGVRSIAILEDDAAGSSAQNLSRLLNDLHEYLLEMKKTYPDLKTTILYCPTDYMNDGSSQKLKTINANVGDYINIMMTGGRVWGEVSPSFGKNFKSNITSDGAPGRAPYMWINWPCSDNSKQHLIMGGYSTFLHPGINPADYQGIVLNPMQQSEPSKVAIFGNADFSWNVWKNKEEAEATWLDSFNFVDHGTIYENGASASLRELSKHMINQNMDSRVTALQESVDLKPKLTAYTEALAAGNVTQEATAEITAEFKKLQAAVKVYRDSAGNTRVHDQIIYWLNCWDDTIQAALRLVDGERAYDAGENDKVWENYSAAQTAYDRSKTYRFHYVDHMEKAEVGVQHIVPFIKTLMSDLGMKVSLILDPNKVIAKFITNRADTPSGDVANVTDGDSATEIIFKSPNSIAEGTYVGLLYNKPIEIEKLKFEMGQAGNLKDTFTKAKLQYTEDGREWLDMDNGVFENNESVIEVQNLNITAMGVRLTATEYKGNTWLGVREITVNDPVKKDVEVSVIRTKSWSVYQGSESNLLDGEGSTSVWYKTPGDKTVAGDYIGVDLGSVSNLGKVRFVIGNTGGDKWEKYHLAYSDDMETWKTFKEYKNGAASGKDIIEEDLSGLSARYVCMFNDEEKGCWVKFSDISVEVKKSMASVYTNVTSYRNLGITENADAIEMEAKTGFVLRPEDYVGIKLSSMKQIKEIRLEAEDAEALTLSVSPNGREWHEIAFTGEENIPKSRYIRLINNSGADVEFDLTRFSVVTSERKGIQFMNTTMGIDPYYGGSDSRRTGTLNAMFDGDYNTNTEFCDYPKKDGYILYDLGMERQISSIRACVKEGEKNYLRDGIIQISNDLEDWTDVVTVGDGAPNGSGDVLSTDGWTHASGGFYYIEGTLPETVKARYLRVYFTAGYDHRFITFNEMIINGGEYVQETIDESFDSNVIEEKGHAPEMMIDGDLTTTYKPGTVNGEIVYHVADPAVDQITIIQKNNSGAKISARVSNTLKAMSQLTEEDTEWIELGSLDKSLVTFVNDEYEYIYDIRMEWGDVIPEIYEMMLLGVARPEESEIREALIEAQDRLENTDEFEYTADSYGELVAAVNHLQKVYAGSRSSEKDFEKAIERYQEAVGSLEAENWYDKAVEIAKKPVKMKYMVNEEFDPAGMEVERVRKASSSNATRNQELSEDQYVYDYDFSQPGKQKVTVFYYGTDVNGGEIELTDDLTVSVVSDEFYTVSLKVTEGPKKIKYKPGEAFDPTGMKLVQVQKASSSNATRNSAVNPADCEFNYDFSETGTKKVTVSFTGEDENGEEKIVKASVNVTVADETPSVPYVTGIAVKVKPDRLSYRLNSEFDPAGMVVAVKKMRDGKPYTAILGDDEYDCTYNFSTTGKKYVTVSYEGVDRDGKQKVFTDKISVTVYKLSDSSSSSDGSRTAESELTAINGTWQADGQNWRFKKADGSFATGWVYTVWQNEANWYHFDAEGRMNEGWFTDTDGRKYYLHAVADGTRGFMYTGWHLIDGKWYYFNPVSDGTRGELYVNRKTPDGYTVGEDGAWIK